MVRASFHRNNQLLDGINATHHHGCSWIQVAFHEGEGDRPHLPMPGNRCDDANLATAVLNSCAGLGERLPRAIKLQENQPTRWLAKVDDPRN